jgi:NADPH2:quinone reductase
VLDAAPEGADGIFDTALLHDTVFGALKDGGTMVVVRGWKPDSTERGIIVKQVNVGQALENTAWLEHLRELASDGKLALRVAQTFAPEQVADAQELMDAGGLRGRAVIVF